MFSTTRLLLRGVKSTDNSSILALYNDKLVATWITESYVVPRNFSSMNTINTMLDSMLMCCVVEELETGEFVGLTGFLKMVEPKNRNAMMFILLMPKHWNKGYGFEAMDFLIDYAFEGLGMHRVSLTVFEGNDRALALYRKLLVIFPWYVYRLVLNDSRGFVEEGRHRKTVWIKGSWRDTFYMGILEDEWAEKRSLKAL